MRRLTKSQAAVVAHLKTAAQPPPSPPQPYTRTNPGPPAQSCGMPSGFSYADAAAQQLQPQPQPQSPAATATSPARAADSGAGVFAAAQTRSPGSPQPCSPGLQDFAWWQDDSKAWQKKHKALAAELGLTPAGMRQNASQGGAAAWGSLEC